MDTRLISFCHGDVATLLGHWHLVQICTDRNFLRLKEEHVDLACKSLIQVTETLEKWLSELEPQIIMPDEHVQAARSTEVPSKCQEEMKLLAESWAMANAGGVDINGIQECVAICKRLLPNMTELKRLVTPAS